MIYIRNLVSILLLALHGQGALKAPTYDALERLQTKISVESFSSVDMSSIAGHYASPPRELAKQLGGFLDGNDLYLFPDGTYIYCEWADVQPLTIYDKGRWTFSSGAVELKSDPDVTWDPEADRTYVAVRRRSQKKEVLLVGVHSDLPRFEAESQDNPELTLLYVAKKRDSTITRSKTARLKARLLRESWHPEEFKAKPTDHDKHIAKTSEAWRSAVSLAPLAVSLRRGRGRANSIGQRESPRFFYRPRQVAGTR